MYIEKLLLNGYTIPKREKEIKQVYKLAGKFIGFNEKRRQEI